MTLQQGISLPAGNNGEPSQVSLPACAGEDASTLYAPTWFETSKGKAAVEVQALPFNQYLQESDQVLLIHASTSSSNQPVNRLANEVLLNRGDGQGENSSSISNINVKGKAYLLYAKAGKDFRLKPDWEALHDVCYGAHIAKAGKQAIDLQSLAKEFITKRDQQGMAIDKEAHIDDDDGGDWTDEEVEKPREPKKDVESDDEDAGDNEANQEEDEEEEEEEEEDSEGSYEDESELESDDDDDPRKKALLEMIQQAIMKDGKIDLDRLGLVEKNGKLVPKDD